MREIKFRAWDITQKLMLPEVAIYFPSDHIGFGVDDYIKWSGGGDLPEHVETGEYDWAYLTDGFELMQYTGLKDTNGTEVYEGDILRSTWNGNIDVVEWDDKDGSWVFMPDTTDHGVKYSGTEVIGNIYENPERLSRFATTHTEGEK